MFITQMATSNPERRSRAESIRLFGLENSEFARRIFDNSEVHDRHLWASERDLDRPFLERMGDANAAMRAGVAQAVAGLRFERENIAAIVVISLYSLPIPALSHFLVDDLGLPPSTPKFQLSAAGCAGAVPTFDIAVACAKRWPGKQILVIAYDYLSAFLTRPEEDDRIRIINCALFGDGCAAFLFGPRAQSDAYGVEILDTAVYQLPGTTQEACFHTDIPFAYMQMSRELPAIAEQRSGDMVDAFLATHGLARADISHWAMHPGGKAILKGFQNGLGLDDAALAPSFGVLNRYGNMATPSALFVLRDVVPHGKPGEHGMLVTVGPGLTMGLALLRWS